MYGLNDLLVACRLVAVGNMFSNRIDKYLKTAGYT